MNPQQRHNPTRSYRSGEQGLRPTPKAPTGIYKWAPLIGQRGSESLEGLKYFACGCQAMPRLPSRIGRFFCWLGWHDFRVINTTFGFGAVGNVEKVKCRRCGVTVTRQA